MMRNDYRRALILLRSNAPGYSGHVRLERRTLMGSMYFLMQVPADCPTLRAALVGRGRDSYYACALGEAKRDGRGQAVLGASFDPRDLCGRELEQYQLIAVSCADDAEHRVLLYGNVNGHAEMNWERVRTALSGLYSDGVARAEDAPPVGELPEAVEEREAAPEVTAPEVTAPEVTAPAETATDDTAEPPAEASDLVQTDEGEAEPSQMEDASQARAAGEALGVDLAQPWPEGTESLRTLFQTLPAMENPPDVDYVYIAAPMPESSGYPYCAAGIRVENGEIASVRYALPAQWTQEPPAGLEDHAWVGDQNRGWWVATVDL